jgi:enamine deaminase RidA (YjgF/YER057c/UK114 family)
MEYENTNLKKLGLRCINAPGNLLKISNSYSLSQSIIVPANRSIVYCSGHTGLNETMEHSRNIEEQVDAAFANVETTLKAAGVKDGWKAVFNMTSYHTSLADEHMEAVMKSHRKYVGDNRPCWTGVAVNDLAEEAAIELQVQAVL